MSPKRDGYYLGSEQEILDKYNQRYIPGQWLYFQEAQPLSSEFRIAAASLYSISGKTKDFYIHK